METEERGQTYGFVCENFRYFVIVVSHRAYLSGKGVSIDGVLAADLIVHPEVQMNFVKLVTIAERAAGDIDRMAGVVLHGEHHAVPGVRQYPVDSVLIQMKRL